MSKLITGLLIMFWLIAPGLGWIDFDIANAFALGVIIGTMLVVLVNSEEKSEKDAKDLRTAESLVKETGCSLTDALEEVNRRLTYEDKLENLKQILKRRGDR